MNKISKSTPQFVQSTAWHNFSEKQFNSIKGKFSPAEIAAMNLSDSGLKAHAKNIIKSNSNFRADAIFSAVAAGVMGCTIVGLPVAWLPLKVLYDNYKDDVNTLTTYFQLDQIQLRERAIGYMEKLEGEQNSVVNAYKQARPMMPQERGLMNIEDRRLAPQVMLRSLEASFKENN